MLLLSPSPPFFSLSFFWGVFIFDYYAEDQKNHKFIRILCKKIFYFCLIPVEWNTKNTMNFSIEILSTRNNSKRKWQTLKRWIGMEANKVDMLHSFLREWDQFYDIWKWVSKANKFNMSCVRERYQRCMFYVCVIILLPWTCLGHYTFFPFIKRMHKIAWWLVLKSCTVFSCPRSGVAKKNGRSGNGKMKKNCCKTEDITSFC